MSLPAVASMADCASWSKTVTPFLHQLSLSHVLPLLRGEISPTVWYLSTNPFITGICFALVLSVAVLIISEVNNNYSQVDRLWSILPMVYIVHYTAFAHFKGLPSQRLDTLATFSMLWGVRLTFNYWRRGGYSAGSEDYRWEVVQAHVPKWGFFILNLTFISFWQNILLFLIASPAYLFLLTSTLPKVPEWSPTDLVVSHSLILTLVAEFFADQQQWAFQEAKRKYRETGAAPPGFQARDLSRGFVVTGLWSLSRHPNFAAEQVIWTLVYLWSCLAMDQTYNWTAVGVASYLALFQCSVRLTEWISAGKYPEYREYQRRVSRFVPGLSAFTGEGRFSGGKEE